MKNEDVEALLKAARFVVGLGKARKELDEQLDAQVSLVIMGETGDGIGGYVDLPTGRWHDDGPGGLLEDPRRALGEDFDWLEKLIAAREADARQLDLLTEDRGPK